MDFACDYIPVIWNPSGMPRDAMTNFASGKKVN